MTDRLASPAASATELGSRLRAARADGRLDAPAPGAGDTPQRWRMLCDIAAHDLELARLAEAHTDAIAILHEASRPVDPNALYGVWAAEDRADQLVLQDSQGRITMSGSKPFCSGADLVDRALVTVRHAGTVVLADVAIDRPGVCVDNSVWETTAFTSTTTATVHFDSIDISSEAIVGTDGWYLDRVGFWHGACAPAACWAGGAIGLAAEAVARTSVDDPHHAALAGALHTDTWALRALLDVAGRQIDAAPVDRPSAIRRAICCRSAVRLLVEHVVTVASDLVGPRGLAFDERIARRVAELGLYVRQHHGGRDLADLGRL
jgi:alkylation response protein AidB-like acyl-CoA dehydrogenase